MVSGADAPGHPDGERVSVRSAKPRQLLQINQGPQGATAGAHLQESAAGLLGLGSVLVHQVEDCDQIWAPQISKGMAQALQEIDRPLRAVEDEAGQFWRHRFP